MRQLRIYFDTSVISMVDAPHVPDKEAVTKAFFQLAADRPDEFELLISPVVIMEIDNCPEPRRTMLFDVLEHLNPAKLEKSDDVAFLAERFLEEKVLGSRHHRDLAHIAYAVVARCDYIVSWNFKHFVNFRTICRVNAVVKEYNYGGVFIVTPETFTGERYHEIDRDSDCNPLEMIWAVREKIYEETKDMTEVEWDAYVQASNDRAEATLARLRAEKQAAVAAGQIVKKPWE